MADPQAVRLVHVNRVFGRGESAVHALKDISLDIARGEWVGLKGRSGSGKTTLINCIGGLDAPSSGSVEVFGEPVHAMSAARRATWRRTQIAYVFQAFALMPMLSAAENVELPLRIAGRLGGREQRARVADALDRVGLTKWKDHRPGELSGGQQQRVALARAIVTRAPLLLADEPTGELDTATTRDILALLRGLVADSGATVVMTSHDPLALEHVDRVIEMVDGRVAG